MSFLPAKRRRGGEQPPHARLVRERHAGDVADLAQVGLLPEQVTLALANHQLIEEYAAPVLAGVDGRTARAYVLVGNTLYTWQLEPAELDKELEAPADRSLELLDRQGYPCITADTPAVAVLAPYGPRMPVAVVLTNGRLVWRELERGGAKSEYTAQLENGEEVTTAAWEMVGGDLAGGGGEAAGVQIMAFLGTTHGRVYRVGPLGGGGGRGGAGGVAISSGPMARPGGLTDYLPWRLRGPGPLESVRSLLVWEEGRGRHRTRRVMTLTGEGVHLYDASGAILAQIKFLEQLRALCHDEAVTLVGAMLLRPGVALVAAAVGLEETEDAHLSLFLLELRQAEGAGGERALAQAQAVPLLMQMTPPAGREGAPLTVDALLQTRLEASRGNTATDIVAYIVHASSQEQQQEDVVTVLHFRLDGAAQLLRARDLQRTDLVVPRVANTGRSAAEGYPAAVAGGLLGVGTLLHTDTLALLMGPEKVLRVRALRHAKGGAAAAGAAEEEAAAAAGADEQRSRDVAGKVRRAFRLYMELHPAQAQAVVEAEGLLDLPDGLPELGAGLRRAIWQEVDLEPDTAPYWAGGGGGGGGEGGQTAQEAFHLLIQHSLRRKLAVSERWLRFLSETGLWAKLTESQGAALLEGAERVAACEQLCAALLPGGGGEDGGREMPAALAELLRAHAMPRWGEDLQEQVRTRLDAAGLPPLDLFLANPSQVMRKLASLQSARKEYMRRTGRPVSKKEQAEASLAITTVVWRALEAAVRTRARLQVEHGVLRREAGRGGWLTETLALQVMEREVERLRELVKETAQPLTPAHCAVIGEKAQQLGTLWLEMGEMGGRWEGEGGREARGKKRVAVLCVAEYGLIQEALAIARRARAWDVLVELEWLHRGWASGALVEDMGRHQEVASHVLNWLLDHSELDDCLAYGATSDLARVELEKVFGGRPDVPAAARLAWMHHVHVKAFGRATEDLKSLAEGEKALDLKKLWVDLGILSDEAARRHLRGQVAEEEARMALKEEQELLQAQRWLADLCRHRNGEMGSAMKKLVEGLAIGPEETIGALIEWVPQERLLKGQAVELALRAMDLLDYYAGRRGEVSREAAKGHVKALWAALIRREEDWKGVWSNCGAMDPGRKVEATAYAAVVSEYMRPRGGEGERSEYPERLATPTEEVIRAVGRGLLATMKYKPQEAALITALERTRNTLWREE